MFWPSLVKLGPRTHEEALSVLTHPLKLHAKCAKSSITQPWIAESNNDVRILIGSGKVAVSTHSNSQYKMTKTARTTGTVAQRRVDLKV